MNLRLTRISSTALPAAFAIVALAGCALPFGSTPARAAVKTDQRQATLQFTQCMRQHGVNLPDPDSAGRVTLQAGSDGPSTDGTGMTDPSDPKFQAAQTACQKYMPNGGPGKMTAQDRKANQAKGLKFSQCMRAHGLPNFPDPQSDAGGGTAFQKSSNPGGPGASGGMFINGQSFSGFDPTSPEFQKAQEACSSIMGIKGGRGPAGPGSGAGLGSSAGTP